MSHGLTYRTKPRINVLRGYPGNESTSLTRSAKPKAAEAIKSGMLISLDSNEEWIKGVPQGKTPFFAMSDQSDTDVIAADKLPALSCNGDYEIETCYFTANNGLAASDVPLIAGTGGSAGLVVIGSDMDAETADVIGVTSRGGTQALAGINSQADPAVVTTSLILTTRWMPVRTVDT